MFPGIPDFRVIRLSDTSFLQKKEVSWYTNSDEDYLQFLIPNRSGLTHGLYWDYVATKGGLSIYYQDNGKREWREWHPMKEKHYRALEQLLSETDSLGFHCGSGYMFFGLRIFINAKHGDRKLEGTIAGCYREHIFRFVDWMNDVYPKGDLIHYDKERLVQGEMEFNDVFLKNLD